MSVGRYIDTLLDGGKLTLDSMSKSDLTRLFYQDFTQVCLSMFEWKNLPPEIDSQQLELYKQLYGKCIFAKVGSQYYVFFGNWSGDCDPYYHPKDFIVSNPWLPSVNSRTFHIGEDCVLIQNDRLYAGLHYWNLYYASLLAEIYCTFRISMINSRAEYVLAVQSDDEAQGAKQFFDDLVAGVKTSYIVNHNIANKENLTSVQLSSGSATAVRASMESAQYLFSQWARGVGLSTSFNRKREYVSSSETSVADEITTPRAEQMLECAKKGAEEINKLFGLNVSVDFSSSWKRERDAMEATTEAEEKQAKEGDKPPVEEAKKDAKD